MNKPCEVALDKERNGKWMHNFSFSSRALQATCITGEEGKKIKIKSSNKFNITLWSKHRNEQQMVAPEEEIDIGDEDEIRFNKDAPYRTIKFKIPGWVPTDPAVSEAQKKAFTMIEDAKEQCEKRVAEIQLNIEKLSTAKSNIKKCGSTMEVDAILTSLPSTFSNLPVETFLERKRTVSDVGPSDLPNLLAGSKRKASEKLPRNTIKSRSESVRTAEEAQQCQKFCKIQQQVKSAKKFLARLPDKPSKKQTHQAQAHRKVLRQARHIKCIHCAQGNCQK